MANRHRRPDAVLRTVPLSFRTTEAGARQLKVWCRRRRLDVSFVIREAIKEFMEKHEETYPVVTAEESKS